MKCIYVPYLLHTTMLHALTHAYTYIHPSPSHLHKLFLSCSVLQYYFYGTDYHGAAHGTIGILYILLQFPEWCKQPDIKLLIQATLDHMLSLQFPSGNFPLQAQSNNKDVQIHWCHGAPGFVYTLYHAHKVYGGDKYMLALERALDVVWQRGVIKKGLGLCHGIAGNAYAFLIMYR